mgnify:CR=1 FL=1
MPQKIINKKEFNKSYSEVTLLANRMNKKSANNIKILAKYIVKYYKRKNIIWRE